MSKVCIRVCIRGVLWLALAGLAGCHEPKVEQVGPAAQLIGHGEGFEYVLPADGRIYIVRDDKVVFMRVMRKGQKFEAIGAAGPDVDPTAFKKNKYYFEPSPQLK